MILDDMIYIGYFNNLLIQTDMSFWINDNKSIYEEFYDIKVFVIVFKIMIC